MPPQDGQASGIIIELGRFPSSPAEQGSRDAVFGVDIVRLARPGEFGCDLGDQLSGQVQSSFEDAGRCQFKAQVGVVVRHRLALWVDVGMVDGVQHLVAQVRWQGLPRGQRLVR